MSETFTLKGVGSELSARYFPAIQLDERYEYSAALVNLETFNSIPNIEEGCDTLHYIDNSGKPAFIKIPTGAYEIRDIEKYLQDHFDSADQIKIRANVNTLKSEIKCKYRLDFSKSNSIGPMLGFVKRSDDLKADEWHISDKTVDILKVSVVRVECNLVSGSYINSYEAHTLHEFFPNVPPGVKIIEVPSHPIYLPVRAKSIDTLSVRLVDQNGSPVNFRDEIVTLRLHLRQDSHGIGDRA